MLRNRKGITLIETMTSIAVLVTVAAVVTPNLSGALDRIRINEMKSSLEALERAIGQFKEDINSGPSQKFYPGRLSHLSSVITTSQRDLCGKPYSSGLTSKWSGPYVQRTIDEATAGFPMAMGQVRNLVGYDAAADHLIVYIDQVKLDDARALNSALDGELDTDLSASTNTTNRLRWGAPDAEQFVTLQFRTPAGSCP